MFQLTGWMRKNFIPGNFSWRVSPKTWDARCFQKGLLEKQQSVPNTRDILRPKKIFFSELNRCSFQISLKYMYIKLVIPKILFILVLCNFTSKFIIVNTFSIISNMILKVQRQGHTTKFFFQSSFWNTVSRAFHVWNMKYFHEILLFYYLNFIAYVSYQ